MKKKKEKSLEELIPDSELSNRVSEQLYSGRPLLAPGSVFSEMTKITGGRNLAYCVAKNWCI